MVTGTSARDRLEAAERTSSQASAIPVVSVVIPTFGRPKIVPNAVTSALAQTLRDIEVIVVIDGSDPETIQRLERIADPTLRIVALEERRGNAGARNAGVEQARAKWIAFLDDDDEWHCEKLERQLALARRIDAPMPIISCRFEATGNGARFIWPARFPHPGQPISEYLFTRKGPSVSGAIQTSTMLVPKALLEQVPFDQSVSRYVDLDWLLRADRLSGVSLHYVQGAPLATYSMDDDRARISNQAGWRTDLAWIRDRRDWVTRRAYGGYCLTQASIRAEKSRDKRAFLPLLREAIAHGRISPGELAFHIGNTLLPARWRRKLTNRAVPNSAKSREPSVAGGRSMRVLIFSAAPKADAAGVQGVVIGLAEYLRGRGHKVVTTWPDGDGTSKDWRLHLEAGVGKSGKPALRLLGRAARDLVGLTAKLARFRPDIVNLHYPRGQTLYFMLLKPLFRYRVVLSYHNSDLHEASDAVRERIPNWLRRAEKVTAVSPELADKLTKITPEKHIEMIENGVDRQFWRPETPERREANLLAAAGRLIPFKGFDVLLSAMTQPKAGDCRLVLAGEGPLEAELRAQIIELGLEGRVDLAGRFDRQQLRALFRRASLFVIPSRREGMPLVLLEAMATGLPAVATAVGGVPRVLSADAGELVEPDNPETLALAIGRRFAKPELLAREANGARRRTERFAASASYGQYERVFAEAIDKDNN